jgi:hypothetical protein
MPASAIPQWIIAYFECLVNTENIKNIDKCGSLCYDIEPIY